MPTMSKRPNTVSMVPQIASATWMQSGNISLLCRTEKSAEARLCRGCGCDDIVSVFNPFRFWMVFLASDRQRRCCSHSWTTGQGNEIPNGPYSSTNRLGRKHAHTNICSVDIQGQQKIIKACTLANDTIKGLGICRFWLFARMGNVNLVILRF